MRNSVLAVAAAVAFLLVTLASNGAAETAHGRSTPNADLRSPRYAPSSLSSAGSRVPDRLATGM
jgi:hypothetical protein